jgi:hypothetical protein
MHDLWKFIVVTITGLVLAGTAVGIVAAQTGEETPSPTAEDNATPEDDGDAEDTDGQADESDKTERKDHYLDTLAGNLGISREQLDAALRQTGLDLLDEAVADGRITEEQAAEARERIESGEGLFPFKGHHRGGFGHGFKVGANLEEVAEFLGVERDVVIEGLSNDQSLAQIAEANGTSRDALVAFLTEQVTERVSEALADGQITQERADEILANSDERINDLVDRQGLPERPGRHFRPGRFFDDETEADEGTTETSGLVF